MEEDSRAKKSLISSQKLEVINNGELGVKGLNKISKKASIVSELSNEEASMEDKVNESQMGFDDGGDRPGSYGLRENPKKSWKVFDSKSVANLNGENFRKEFGKGFNSLKALSGHMRSHSMKGKELLNCCKKCGKGFESLRAMCGHMRSHSNISKQINESKDEKEIIKLEPIDKIVNIIRKKRSITRYKITTNPSYSSSLNLSFSSMMVDDEVEETALSLLMLSTGVRNRDEFSEIEKGKFGISEFDSGHSRNVDHEVEFDESFEGFKFKDQSEMGWEKGVIMTGTEVDFGQAGMGLMSKKLKSNGQDSCDEEIFDANETETENDELKRSKDYECSICFKVFGSGQALGGHKRAHYNGTN